MPDSTSLSVITPKVTQFDGSPVWEKLRAIELFQNQVATLRLQFVSRDGNPIDLSSFSDKLTLQYKLKLSEITALDSSLLFSVNGVVSDPVQGYVDFGLNTDNGTGKCGIYLGQYWIEKANGDVVHINQIYISIIPSLLNTSNRPYLFGPISSQELQLAIRGSSPVESTLLQEIEFDLAEIIQSLRWPVEFWNTSAPDIGIYYTTENFPYKFQWVEAAIGELLLIGAHRYRRDHLPHQVAGIAIDDTNKFQQYDQAGMLRRQMYQRFVRNRKLFIDIAGGFGSVPGVMRRIR